MADKNNKQNNNFTFFVLKSEIENLLKMPDFVQEF